jgi:lysophospholipase L1-like esterase
MSSILTLLLFLLSYPPLASPQLRWPIIEKNRISANQLLRDYVNSCKRVALVDLEDAWDQKGKSSFYWWAHDYVHLSKAGYEDLARRVYDVMLTFEVPDDPAPCPGDAVQRRHRHRLRQ